MRSRAGASLLPPAQARRRVLLGLLALAAPWGPAPTLRAQERPPALMLANVYQPGLLDLSGYWLSEKYDGVRGRWDGWRLLTRSGETIQAPPWFTAGWPAEPMDGELWAGRGRFEATLSTVRKQVPDDAAWRRLRFMVFDLPAHPGVFTERITAYGLLVAAVQQPWLQAVPQTRASDHASLMSQLETLVRDGAEGLMLHRGDALYQARRSDDLLKVKTHDDAEAQVVGHVPGQGRHAGRLGALEVRTDDGLRFRIGSGLSDALREDPPPVGSWITYRYRGLHDSGLPRFATFLRVRTDLGIDPIPRP